MALSDGQMAGGASLPNGNVTQTAVPDNFNSGSGLLTCQNPICFSRDFNPVAEPSHTGSNSAVGSNLDDSGFSGNSEHLKLVEPSGTCEDHNGTLPSETSECESFLERNNNYKWRDAGLPLNVKRSEQEARDLEKSICLISSPSEASPFGGFIAVALSTLLTIILAWRILFEDSTPRRAANSINSPETGPRPNSRSKLREPPPVPSSVPPAPFSTTSANSPQRSSPPGIATTSNPIMELPEDDLEFESDISCVEDIPPPYLDTITEEDTDDLRSLSSNDDGLKSPPRRPALPNLASHARPLAVNVNMALAAKSDPGFPPPGNDGEQVIRENGNTAHNNDVEDEVLVFDENLNKMVNSKKSPSEERFLRAYENYIKSAAAADQDLTSSTTTLSEEPLVPPDPPGRNGVSALRNVLVSTADIPGIPSCDYADAAMSRSLNEELTPVAAPQQATLNGERLADNGTRDQYQPGPSNSTNNGETLGDPANVPLTVHLLSYHDCSCPIASSLGLLTCTTDFHGPVLHSSEHHPLASSVSRPALVEVRDLVDLRPGSSANSSAAVSCTPRSSVATSVHPDSFYSCETSEPCSSPENPGSPAGSSGEAGTLQASPGSQVSPQETPSVAPKPSVLVDRTNRTVTVVPMQRERAAVAEGVLDPENNGGMRRTPHVIGIENNNNKTPGASTTPMSGFMKEECTTLNPPTTAHSLPCENDVNLNPRSSSSAGEAPANSSPYHHTGPTPYSASPRQIATVQYRPPGVSIRSNLINNHNDSQSPRDGPSQPDENSNMAADSYLHRYERYERRVELSGSETAVGPNNMEYKYSHKEFTEEVRAKQNSRGRIPWATASVFPARDGEMRAPDPPTSLRYDTASPSKVRVTSYDSSPLTPIPPPADLREVEVGHRTVKPKLVGPQYISSEQLQRMLQPYEGPSPRVPDRSQSSAADAGSRRDRFERPEMSRSNEPSRGTSMLAEKGSTTAKSKESLPPTYNEEKKKSIETLFPVTPPGSTGKPTSTEPKTYPTRKGEPPKRPVPLNEKTLEWWSSLPQNKPDNSQHLMRWRNSINFSDENIDDIDRLGRKEPSQAPKKVEHIPTDRYILEPKKAERVTSPKPKPKPVEEPKPVLEPVSDDLLRFRRPQQPINDEESFEARQSQRNKYKAKIDKAKKNFIESDSKASVGDLSKPKEEFENKHKVNLEQFMRKVDPPRGPLLTRFHDPIFKSTIDIRYREVKPNYRTPQPLWDDEYKKLVEKAEEAWKEYRKKSNPDLYKNSRAKSMGYLETDLDSGRVPRAAPRPERERVDLNKSLPPDEPESVRGRARTKSSTNMDEGRIESSHSRAKSFDYLIDHRETVEPPENELHKTVARILGRPPVDHTPSEHELRFQKSLEKLHVPNWYLESDNFGKQPREMERGQPARRTMPSLSSRATTPGYGYREPNDREPLSDSFSIHGGQGDQSFNSSYHSRTTPTPSYQKPSSSYQKPYIAPVDDSVPGGDTRYAKPWSYLDDSKNPTPPKFERPRVQPKPPEVPERPRGTAYVPPVVPGSDLLHKVAPPSRPRETPPSLPAVPPRKLSEREITQGVFERYKDEINELWHSRKSLRQSQNSLHRSEPELPPRPATHKSTEQMVFDRYKDEINELWHSRKSLRRSQESLSKEHQNGARPSAVPVATVKPRLQGHESASPTPTSSSHPRPGAHSQASVLTHQSIPVEPYPPQSRPRDLNIPPPYAPPPPPNQDGFGNDDDAMYTSTPSHSGHLPRKQYAVHEHIPIEQSSPRPVAPPVPARPVHRHAPGPSQTPPAVPQHHHHAAYAKSGTPTTPGHPVPKAYQGYSVGPLPASYNEPRNRNSRVIEVADLGHGSGSGSGQGSSNEPSSAVTLEEVLDSLLGLPNRGTTGRLEAQAQGRPAAYQSPTRLPPGQPIFTANHDAMLQAAAQPGYARDILKKESLLVRCQYCGKVAPLTLAWQEYVTCRYCYTYYCTRDCRRADWPSSHVDACTFSRINTLCKEVIVKVREDMEAQSRMSRVARAGYNARGRGSVNFRFRYPHYALIYLEGGWDALAQVQPESLFYCTVQDLSAEGKSPPLIQSCRRYDPQAKFVLSVSIIADVDRVPETPPMARRDTADPARYQNGVAAPFQNRAQSLPPKAVKRTAARNSQQPETIGDAKVILKSILRSMENIVPGPPEIEDRRTPVTPTPSYGYEDQQQRGYGFQRSAPERSTVAVAQPRSYDAYDQVSIRSYTSGRIVGHGTESFV